ncbi:MAG: GntR family transcriptional regulator [Thermodesulfovibrionales bacterium]|nr:GntR family transcriptional regulator [Thermodesulfovibrionales bacterium]MDP3112172.1 GntR family transcriptional regulator [Thermodesulfovibrionales bacterium]
MELVHRENPQKLYLQLEGIIKKKIEDKEWAIGSQIPTEEEFCKIYGVSKAPVRAAILELVRQGYLMRQQGKGTFVCKKIISEGLTMLVSFKELMLEAGIIFTTKALAQTVMMPTDDLDIKLNISEDKHIIYLKRLRRVDNEPILLQESYIPYHVCPQMLAEDVENNSLLELLEKKHGIKITKVKDYIELEYLTKEESRLLGLPEGAAAMLLTQYFYSGDTQVMYMRSIKRPDRFKFLIELDRSAA